MTGKTKTKMRFGRNYCDVFSYVVLQTSQLSKAQAASLLELQSQAAPFGFWKEPMAGRSCNIMASEDNLQELKDTLAELGVDFGVHVEDVQE